jgi:hypothetical protein
VMNKYIFLQSTAASAESQLRAVKVRVFESTPRVCSVWVASTSSSSSSSSLYALTLHSHPLTYLKSLFRSCNRSRDPSALAMTTLHP